MQYYWLKFGGNVSPGDDNIIHLTAVNMHYVPILSSSMILIQAHLIKGGEFFVIVEQCESDACAIQIIGIPFASELRKYYAKIFSFSYLHWHYTVPHRLVHLSLRCHYYHGQH